MKQFKENTVYQTSKSYGVGYDESTTTVQYCVVKRTNKTIFYTQVLKVRNTAWGLNYVEYSVDDNIYKAKIRYCDWKDCEGAFIKYDGVEFYTHADEQIYECE